MGVTIVFANTTTLWDMRLLFLTLVFFMKMGYGQDTSRTLSAHRIDELIELDGVLDDPQWHEVEFSSGFTQMMPDYGQPSTKNTHVKVLYDDDAVYFGLRMEEEREDVYQFLSERDDEGNADWIAVIIDPYDQGLYGYGYGVTAAGVQIDGNFSIESETKEQNLVWLSEVSIQDHYWEVELMIPYAAIRFPKKDIQHWGFQVARERRGTREVSYWNPWDPNQLAFVAQLGNLKGIEGIDPPLRLSVTPYVSSYLESSALGNGVNLTGNAGMDLKYGINEAFTLDVSLIPDFGQVQFDQLVYNLSPFEVRYNENRQFFTEGLDLFDTDLFYSRRIGDDVFAPEKVYEALDDGKSLVSMPAKAPLINATKLSGRTENGLGIGVVNGIVNNAYAIVEDEDGNREEIMVQPLSNYNIAVFDQNLKNNSKLSLVNSNVWRSGHFMDANVTELYTDLYNEKQTLNAYGGGSVSRQRSSDEGITGYTYNVNLAGPSGNVQWDCGYKAISDTYDPNDLGYLYNNNFQVYDASLSYNIYEPHLSSVASWASTSFTYNRLFSPDVYAGMSIEGNVGTTFRSFTSVGISGYKYGEINDYFEPRVEGMFLYRPDGFGIGGWMSSNYAKTLSIDLDCNMDFRNSIDANLIELTVSPRIRMGSRSLLVLSSRFELYQNFVGTALTQDWDIVLENEAPIIGIRDQDIVENAVILDYVFTNRMNMRISARHYWTQVRYNSFHVLGQHGTLNPTAYTGEDGFGNSLHNTTFNLFTLDAGFQWVFAPGSVMSAVYKHTFSHEETIGLPTYFETVKSFQDFPAVSSISVKVLYYLDYSMIKAKRDRRAQ